MDWDTGVHTALLNSALISPAGTLFYRFNFAYLLTFKTKKWKCVSWNKKRFIHFILLCFSYHSLPAFSIHPTFSQFRILLGSKGVHTSTPHPCPPFFSSLVVEHLSSHLLFPSLHVSSPHSTHLPLLPLSFSINRGPICSHTSCTSFQFISWDKS